MLQSPTFRPVARSLSLTIPAALFLMLAGCGSLPGAPQMAVDFQVTLFSGDEFQMSDQIGHRAVVLNFWFPSCPPCRAEMPDFEEAWRDLQGKDVRFLGLFVPRGLDSEQDARDFVQELGLTYDVATDTRAEIADAYGLKYYPTTIFIDKSGRIHSTEISVLDRDEITQIVSEMAQG